MGSELSSGRLHFDLSSGGLAQKVQEIGYGIKAVRTQVAFNIHGSVHLGNICSIKGPIRCTYYVFFIPLYI
jgi:hypothetical protein